MIKRLLGILINCVLWMRINSDSHVVNIVSPKVDYSNNQIGSLSITFHFQANFEPATLLPDLIGRIVFPFALTAPLAIEWIQISDACIVSSNTKKISSVASAIPGDSPGAHFFTMAEANYFAGAKYKLIVEITNTADIPVVVGNSDPILFELTSSMAQHYIVYSYNYHFGYLLITDPAPSDFEFDLTPSYNDANIREFTRDFFGRADVRLTNGQISRILIKLKSYVFSDDAESTCNTEPDDSKSIVLITRDNFFCEFENDKKKGLYFVFKEGSNFPLHQTFRLRFRVKNNDLPSSTDLSVAMFKRHSPQVLKFKSITNAFFCGPTSFAADSPKIFLGPNLDVSSPYFPNVTLFTTGDKTNTIIYNTIRIEFRIGLDLPKPAVSYKIYVRIGGSAATTIPLSLIYHDLPVAVGLSRVKVTLDAGNAGIIFENIGELSSRSTYTIGFKIGFRGTEAPLVFVGDLAFGAMDITDSFGAVVVLRKHPPNLQSSFKVQPVVNLLPNTQNMLTYIHTKELTAVNADYVAATLAINTNYGLRIGSNKRFFLHFSGLDLLPGFTPVVNQNFIQIISSASITATPTAAGDWLAASTATNCFTRGHATGASIPLLMSTCRYDFKNKGLSGSEYSVFRMGGASIPNFYSTAQIYGWNNVVVSKMSSLIKDADEAAVLDFYVNIYDDVYTSDITAFFPRGLKYTGLVNGYVLTTSQFSNTKIDFQNYWRTTSDVLPGDQIPTFLRISGRLDGVNTFKLKKLVLFFSDFTAFTTDVNIPYEVGCSTSSTSDIKCYYYQGVANVPCAPGLCNNFASQNRLEILFSSTISSIADIYDIQVIVPIKFVSAVNLHTYNIILGTSGQYAGTLSSFPELLSLRNNYPTITACTACPAGSYTAPAITLSAAQVQSSATQNRAVLIVSPPTLVGNAIAPDINFLCSAGNCAISVIGTDYYGITYCAPFDFMSEAAFKAGTGTFVYEMCVPRITYYDTVNSRMRYCLYCPQWSTGSGLGNVISITNYKNPANYGLNVPTGVFSAVSGTIGATKRALVSIVNNAHLNLTPAYSVNSILDFVITPDRIPYDDVLGSTKGQSIKLVFSFVTSNPVPVNGYINFSSAANFPFEFINLGTSPYCRILTYNLPCTVVIVSGMEFEIRPTQEIKAGKVEIVFYGLRSRKVNPLLPSIHTINIFTSIATGKTALLRIDSSGGVPAQLTIFQYQELAVDAALNIMKVDNLILSETNTLYRTMLSLDVTLGNAKNFYPCDTLQLNLNAGAYIPLDILNPRPLFCYVVDPLTDKILVEFKTCDVTDLNNVIIRSTVDTGTNKFRVKFTNYEIILGTGGGTPPLGNLYFESAPATVLQAQIPADPQPVWPVIAPSPTLTAFTVTKSGNFFGLRSDYKFAITTNAVAMAFESRIYIAFPAHYSARLSSFPVSCYRVATPTPEKLYCWILRERTLAISGFPSNIAASTPFEIMVYGIQQPLTSYPERFFISIDSDTDPTVIGQFRAFAMAAPPSSILATIPVLNIVSSEYSHKYIRAFNTLALRINSPISIAAGSFISVYIDYLKYEFDLSAYTGLCSIRLTKTGANLASACVREGNRYRITVGAVALTSNTEYTVLVENIATPDFYACKVKRPEVMVYSSANVLQLISTDIFQNTDVATFNNDEAYTYFNFDGMTYDTPLPFKKGIYNELKVVRMDGSRFNDDFNFTLATTENGLFAQLQPTQFKVHDSNFGLVSLPLYLSSTLNGFVNEILLTVNLTARFRNSVFAKLPLLRTALTNAKTVLDIPSSLTVWTSKGSLPFYVRLKEVPIADITFTISFTGTTSLTATPASITLGQATRLIRVTVASAHPNAPSLETVQMLFTPTGATGYQVTSMPITLKVIEVSTEPAPKMSISEPKPFGLSVDVVSHKPISFYTITMPLKIYRKFTRTYIINKYNSNNRTDNNYYVDYSISQGVSVFNVPINTNELRSKENYRSIIYWTDYDGLEGELTLEVTTQDSAGGFGYVELTFSSPVKNTLKSDLICHIAQIFNYPLIKYAFVLTKPPNF
jgi:hypothetical protein